MKSEEQVLLLFCETATVRSIDQCVLQLIYSIISTSGECALATHSVFVVHMRVAERSLREFQRFALSGVCIYKLQFLFNSFASRNRHTHNKSCFICLLVIVSHCRKLIWFKEKHTNFCSKPGLQKEFYFSSQKCIPSVGISA